MSDVAAPALTPLLVAGPALSVEAPAEFGETVRLPFLKTGEWTFASDYGDIAVTDTDLDTVVRNFERDARRQDIAVTGAPLAPWNEEHDPFPDGADPATYVGPGAVGWIKGLERDGDTVYAEVELNRLGEQLMRDDRYRGVSPELMLDWTDPESLESWGMTAVGGAFTTRPRMKGLAHRDSPMTELAASEARVLAFAEQPVELADSGGADDGDGGEGPGTDDSDHDHVHDMAESDGDGEDGDGKVDCPTCSGAGKVMGGKRDCPDCDGSGKVAPAKAKQLKAAELSTSSTNDLPVEGLVRMALAKTVLAGCEHLIPTYHAPIEQPVVVGAEHDDVLGNVLAALFPGNDVADVVGRFLPSADRAAVKELATHHLAEGVATAVDAVGRAAAGHLATVPDALTHLRAVARVGPDRRVVRELLAANITGSRLSESTVSRRVDSLVEVLAGVAAEDGAGSIRANDPLKLLAALETRMGFGHDVSVRRAGRLAELSSASQNDLPDSAFAYIEPGGEKDADGKTTPRSLRHYPVQDKAHADNAAARAAQQMKKGGKGAAIAQKAISKIRAAQRKYGTTAAAELASVHIDKPLTNLTIAYAYPDQQRLPLHTAEAVKGSMARFQTVEASEEERDQAWGALRKAAEEHGVNVPTSWRELKASECAALLMQEGLDGDVAEDIAEGQLAPCVWQPPYCDFGRCPGYTRSDPDNDGDADCCLMASKGCNGYQPMVQVQPSATFVSPQASTYYRELASRSGGPMRQTENTKEEPVKASEPAPEPVAEPAAPPAPEATVPPAEPEAVAQPAPEPAAPEAPAEPEKPSTAQADLSEFQAILAAERKEREALTARLVAAETNVQAEREARLRMEAATRLAEVAGRVESLVRSGRITPAQRELVMAEPAKLSEDPSFLAVLEAAPENSAVDMRERGTGNEESRPESARLEAAAKALMSERNQALDQNDPNFFKNYKAALLEVGRTGYRAR